MSLNIGNHSKYFSKYPHFSGESSGKRDFNSYRSIHQNNTHLFLFNLAELSSAYDFGAILDFPFGIIFLLLHGRKLNDEYRMSTTNNVPIGPLKS